MKTSYVEGLGKVRQSGGDLYTNVNELGKLISPRNEAYARMHSSITDGTRVSMAVRHFKGEVPILIKNAMTKRLAKQLVHANSQGKYFSTSSPREYEQARTLAEKQARDIEPAKRTAIACPSRDVFGMSPITYLDHLKFIFEDLADASGENSYWQFARKAVNAGEDFVINFYPIDKDIVDGNQPQELTSLNGTVENYLWFRSLGSGSGLGGGNGDAGSIGGRARGVSSARHKVPSVSRKNSGVKSLDERVSVALERKQAFEYNGVVWVPARKNSISLPQ